MSPKPLRVLSLMLVVALFAVVLSLAGCTTTPESETPKSTAVQDEPVTEEEPAEVPQIAEENALYTAIYEPTGSEIAVITTPKGVIKFEFYTEDAPNHVSAFIELSQKGFYDGTKFHRVVPGFVIQGGDPLSKDDDPNVGTGGPGYRLAAEFNSRQHLDGTVSMARLQHPDSAGSQFYICLGPQSRLDGDYTVFGQVTEGMDVVRAIAVGDVMQSVTIENAAQ